MGCIPNPRIPYARYLRIDPDQTHRKETKKSETTSLTQAITLSSSTPSSVRSFLPLLGLVKVGERGVWGEGVENSLEVLEEERRGPLTGTNRRPSSSSSKLWNGSWGEGSWCRAGNSRSSETRETRVIRLESPPLKA